MRRDKAQAIDLRRSGKSYKEINKLLNIPLGTLSNWFGKEDWSKDISESLASKKVPIKELHKVRNLKLRVGYEQAKYDAEKEFRFFKNNALFVAGVVAYWVQGDKTSKYWCKLSSSDAGVIRLYLQFLRVVCSVPQEKITASLLLYPESDEQTCIAYWIEHTGIPRGNFRKTLYIKGRLANKRVSYGICSVTVSSRSLKEKVLVWLKLLSADLPNMRP